MHVLLVAEYYFANPPLMNLSRELAKGKHKVTVLTSYRTMDRDSKTEGIEILEAKPLVTIYKIPRAISFPLLKVSRIIRKRGIDVIHAPNDGSASVATAALLAKCTGRPFVYSIQGPGTRTGSRMVDTLADIYDYTLDRWLAKQAEKVILLSGSLISRAKKLRVNRSKIVVIHSGVDSEHFNPESSEVKKKASQLKDRYGIHDETVIGYVGRLYPAKGLAYLFQAAGRIREEHPNIMLLIVGDGAQRSELEAIAKDSRIRSLFAGWQHDPRPFYLLMDIFVLPSLFEGLPNVVLEAMAMKIPVVATRVGGNPDILSSGENGFLVPVRDSQELASSLEKLIADSDLRAKMGDFNRQTVQKHFLWSKTAESVEAVYRDCLK